MTCEAAQSVWLATKAKMVFVSRDQRGVARQDTVGLGTDWEHHVPSHRHGWDYMPPTAILVEREPSLPSRDCVDPRNSGRSPSSLDVQAYGNRFPIGQ
jgi:hypothetical protein